MKVVIYLMNDNVKNFIEENFPVIFSHNKVANFDFMLKKFKNIKKDEKLPQPILEKLSLYEDNKEWKLLPHLEVLKGIDLNEVLNNQILVKLLNDFGIKNFIELIVLLENYPYMLFQLKGIGNKTYIEIVTKVYNQLVTTFGNSTEEIEENIVEIKEEIQENRIITFFKKILNWIIKFIFGDEK